MPAPTAATRLLLACHRFVDAPRDAHIARRDLVEAVDAVGEIGLSPVVRALRHVAVEVLAARSSVDALAGAARVATAVLAGGAPAAVHRVPPAPTTFAARSAAALDTSEEA